MTQTKPQPPVLGIITTIMSTVAALLTTYAVSQINSIPTLAKDVEILQSEQLRIRNKIDQINDTRFSRRDGDNLDKRIHRLEREAK